MAIRRFVGVALAIVTTAVSVPAQQRGNFEVGAFGQVTRADAPWALKNSIGFGGRLGVFLTSRWEFEADGSTTSFDTEAPRAAGSITGQTYAGRFTYNAPFGNADRPHHFLIGLGLGGERIDGHQDFSVSPGIGLRWRLGNRVALRFDALTEFVENPMARQFGFPPVPPTPGVTVNPKAARSTNMEFRFGLSLVSGKKAAPPPPPAPAPTPAPPPPPAAAPAPPPPPPPPAPAPVVAPPPRPNADSIARVNSARAALMQKIYFDFNKENIRDDQKATLDAMVPLLNQYRNVRIRFEGHADERGSDEYNVALGQRRAQEAKNYLVNKGIDASRIDITSFGEERPVCQEHEEACWAKNRRDETVIASGAETIR